LSARPLTHRLVRTWLLLWALVIAFSIGAAVLGPHGSPVQIAAGFAFGAMFVLHFAVVLTGIFLQGRARKHLDRATAMAESDPTAALALARRAIGLGMPNRSMMRAWLLVARFAAAEGRWNEADEALARAHETKGWLNERDAVVHLALQTAFVKAVLGELDDAEKQLLVFGTVDESHPRRLSDWVRAKALLLYKRESFRAVVDFLEMWRPRITIAERDAALLAAIEQSSLLRMQAGGAHRVAAPSREDDAWLDTVLELERREA
jgi:hypothetical protein